MDYDKTQEALKLALEALEQWNTPLYKRGNVITALRRALAVSETHKHRHISYVCPQCHWSLEEQPAAPQRSEDKKQWVGLLLSEANEIANEVYGKTDAWEVEAIRIDFVRAIEAKLREKNQ